ncbi:MAG: FAD-dependent oxidoreductase [Ruminococcus flavefaciens]|mgnify:CR=1 FL=1|nr:FAD-dependent oxidoreductase [Ruminococcus flavefaciens]
MYDTAIIGTGPAGLSAAVNLKIHNKNIIWFGSKDICEKVALAEKIENYPGLYGVSGKELAASFREHAEKMGLEVNDHVVNNVVPMGNKFGILAGTEFCEAKTVLLATGVSAKGQIKGESERLGRGVSYCATCDGRLYKGKRIAVICNAARLEHEVRFLAELAEHIDYFPYYKEIGIDMANVTVHTAKPTEVTGDGQVETLKLSDGSELEISGLFCLRTSVSLATMIKEVETEDGHIKVGRDQSTNVKGCFAAGDCTGRPYQYTKSVGEGNVAAHSIIDYLAQEEK